MPEASTSEYVATILFLTAVIHTFSVSFFKQIANRFREGSVGENFFHLLSEVEVVFGIWAGVFCVYLAFSQSLTYTVSFLESQNFTEPVFVFVIMALSATRPVLDLASQLIFLVSRLLPVHKNVAFYLSCLIIGPLLGSLITEPAAMTVTALILKRHLFDQKASQKLKYMTLGNLFVAISVGGVLTHFAAPPVLMVASRWGWDTPFMMTQFGYKAVLIVIASAIFSASVCFKEITKLPMGLKSAGEMKSPWWLTFIHVFFLFGVVFFAHYMAVFVGLFLFFLGLVAVTKEYQSELKLKEALLVAFFLGGLVVLGSPQRWWLEPLLISLSNYALFFGATGLTAITDNAALTYLGSQVPGLSDGAKYFLVAGAVTGGGLTVIANAPNPAGYGILQECFGEKGIEPLKLFVSALIPTLIAVLGFVLL